MTETRMSAFITKKIIAQHPVFKPDAVPLVRMDRLIEERIKHRLFIGDNAIIKILIGIRLRR